MACAVLKVVYQGDIRRTQFVAGAITYQDIVQSVSSLFPDASGYIAVYLDEEGDACTLCEASFQDFLAVSRSSKQLFGAGQHPDKVLLKLELVDAPCRTERTRIEHAASSLRPGTSTDVLCYPVEVADGRSLQIQWARGDHPEQVATGFAELHGIQGDELATIVDFVCQVEKATKVPKQSRSKQRGGEVQFQKDVPGSVSFTDTEGDESTLRLDHRALSWHAGGICYLKRIKCLEFDASMDAIKAPEHSMLVASLVDPPAGPRRDALLQDLVSMAVRAGVELRGFPIREPSPTMELEVQKHWHLGTEELPEANSWQEFKKEALKFQKESQKAEQDVRSKEKEKLREEKKAVKVYREKLKLENEAKHVEKEQQRAEQISKIEEKERQRAEKEAQKVEKQKEYAEKMAEKEGKHSEKERQRAEKLAKMAEKERQQAEKEAQKTEKQRQNAERMAEKKAQKAEKMAHKQLHKQERKDEDKQQGPEKDAGGCMKDEHTLSQNKVRPCANSDCKYQATWHPTHCCNACAAGGRHGPRCAGLEYPQDKNDQVVATQSAAVHFAFPVNLGDACELHMVWSSGDDLQQVGAHFADEHGLPVDIIPQLVHHAQQLENSSPPKFAAAPEDIV